MKNLGKELTFGVNLFMICCLCSQEVEERIRGQSPIMFEDFVKPFQINLDEVVLLSLFSSFTINSLFLLM